MPYKKGHILYVCIPHVLADYHPTWCDDAYIYSVLLKSKTIHDDGVVVSDVDVLDAEHGYLLQCFTGVGAEQHLPYLLLLLNTRCSLTLCISGLMRLKNFFVK